MKKEILKISMLGIVAIVLCILVLQVSCNKNPDCPNCYKPLSNEEMNFICYSGGEKIPFKNDSTNTLYTLHAYEKGFLSVECSAPCNLPNGRVIEGFSLTHLGYFELHIENHGWTPQAWFFSSHNMYDVIFYDLNVPTQTVVVDGTTYNDVYSVQTDSTKIDTSNWDKQKIPWKIDYSKSKGFVRFHMVNGQTWSKL